MFVAEVFEWTTEHLIGEFAGAVKPDYFGSELPAEAEVARGERNRVAELNHPRRTAGNGSFPSVSSGYYVEVNIAGEVKTAFDGSMNLRDNFKNSHIRASSLYA